MNLWLLAITSHALMPGSPVEQLILPTLSTPRAAPGVTLTGTTIPDVRFSFRCSLGWIRRLGEHGFVSITRRHRYYVTCALFLGVRVLGGFPRQRARNTAVQSDLRKRRGGGGDHSRRSAHCTGQP